MPDHDDDRDAPIDGVGLIRPPPTLAAELLAQAMAPYLRPPPVAFAVVRLPLPAAPPDREDGEP